MIIFYSDCIEGKRLSLTTEDSAHCARVLRHKVGDVICAIDGLGTMHECTVIDANPSKVQADITASHPGWHSHPYHLTMAVCPTKNADRIEWFVEKAVEIGVDDIVPLIAERSERKVFKTERLKKISVSATKQSLKSKLPKIWDPVTIKDFLDDDDSGLRLIACCYDDEDHPRRSIKEAIGEYLAGRASFSECSSNCPSSDNGRSSASTPRITVLIGPEGDFSEAELQKALAKGYVPVHIGDSRLRTETAALVSTAVVYSSFL